MRMTRRSFLLSGLLVSSGMTRVFSQETKQKKRPNVIVFLMDDMGYGDCRAYNPDSRLHLPVLEQMAREGMLFMDAHSPSAVCAPTRYSMLTGNYPWRGRDPHGTWGYAQDSQILPGQETLGHVMRRAGYHNAFLGKMHLGGEFFDNESGQRLRGWRLNHEQIDFSRPIGMGPLEFGFDYSYVIPSGIQGEPYAFFENDRLVGEPENLKMWEEGQYGDSVIQVRGFGQSDWDSSQAGPILTRKALDFIDGHIQDNQRRKTERPFFLYYCSQSCHTPHTPPQTLNSRTIEGASGISAHLDMIYEADVTLGKMINRLKDAGELENTLILFTSDNGGLAWKESRERGHHSSGPLRGSKALIWEGGHRVPMFAKWGDGTAKGSIIPPASRTDALVGLQDIFATLVELTGQTLAADQGLDSYSFWGVLKGQENAPVRRTLLVQANITDRPGQRLKKMIRDNQWKLITTRDLKPIELYNLAEDLAEENNLINHSDQKQRIEKMLADLHKIFNSKRSTPLRT